MIPEEDWKKWTWMNWRKRFWQLVKHAELHSGLLQKHYQKKEPSTALASQTAEPLPWGVNRLKTHLKSTESGLPWAVKLCTFKSELYQHRTNWKSVTGASIKCCILTGSCILISLQNFLYCCKILILSSLKQTTTKKKKRSIRPHGNVQKMTWDL